MKNKLIQIYEWFIRTLIPLFGRIFRRKNKYVNVIYYHDIVNNEGLSYMRTNKEVFKTQMQELASRGIETVRFDELESSLNLSYNPQKVLIAFDDGWRSNYTEIFDFMKELGLKYNIFLTTGEIGLNPEYLSWEQVKEMYNSGLVGFGAHTHTHPSMKDLSVIDTNVEIIKANAIIKEELGFEPQDFCYPFGFFSEDSNIYLEKETCYKRIYTSEQIYTYMQNEKLVFGRNGISTDDSITVFMAKVRGYTNFMQYFNKYVWLPLLNVYHLIRK